MDVCCPWVGWSAFAQMGFGYLRLCPDYGRIESRMLGSRVFVHMDRLKYIYDICNESGPGGSVECWAAASNEAL